MAQRCTGLHTSDHHVQAPVARAQMHFVSAEQAVVAISEQASEGRLTFARSQDDLDGATMPKHRARPQIARVA